MKITVIGSGSTYTPGLVLRWLETKRDRIPLEELWLYDPDPVRNKVVGDFIVAMMTKEAPDVKVYITSNRVEAVKDASFVISQMRVGLNTQRHIDEHLCVKHGFVGQETTGPGGFALALRQVPASVATARDVKEYAAKGAWLISVANPSGLLAEALIKHGYERSIGMCHGGIAPRQTMTRLLGLDDESRVDFEYVGLNHLSWISNVYVDGNPLPRQKVTDLAVAMYDEWVRFELNLDPEFARDFCPPFTIHHYMTHFYMHDECVKEMRETGKTRADAVLEIERQCLEYYKKEVGKQFTPPEILSKRGGVIEEKGRKNYGAIGYSDGCLHIVDALMHPEPQNIVVNVLNQGSISGLPDDASVEVSAYVNNQGVHRRVLGELPIEVRGQVHAVKAYETMTVEAALTGDRDLALKALLSNPICHCRYRETKALLNDLLEANREFLPQFFK